MVRGHSKISPHRLNEQTSQRRAVEPVSGLFKKGRRSDFMVGTLTLDILV